MNNLNEILAFSAPFVMISIFAIAVIWTIHNLDKDNKKHSRKTKKA